MARMSVCPSLALATIYAWLGGKTMLAPTVLKRYSPSDMCHDAHMDHHD